MIDRATRELMIEAAQDAWTGGRDPLARVTDAVLTALDTAGYCIVPKEATASMIVAGQQTSCVHDELNCGAEYAYAAMVAKAQEGQ